MYSGLCLIYDSKGGTKLLISPASSLSFARNMICEYLAYYSSGGSRVGARGTQASPLVLDQTEARRSGSFNVSCIIRV